MLIFLLAALLAPQPEQDCRFIVSPSPIEPTITRSADVPRVRILTQPDAPVAIVSANLRDIKIVGDAQSHLVQRGAFSIDLKNVSDQPVANAEVVVFVGPHPRSGGGSGAALQGVLAPGAVGTINGREGGGSGTNPNARGDLVVWLYISSVDVGECTYEPSRLWRRPVTDVR